MKINMNTRDIGKSNKFGNNFQSQNNPKGKLIIHQVYKTIHQYFPDLPGRISQFADSRKRKQYEIAGLVTAY